jgi:DNA polymerase-1
VKILNFLTIFGGGVAATAGQLRCGQDEAKAFREVYFQAFPEAKDTISQVKAVAERRGWVHSPLGRRSRFPWGHGVDYNGNPKRMRMRTHKALNCVCQMTEADMLKTNMVELHARRKELGYTPRVCLHDELNGRLEDREKEADVLALLNTQWIPLKVPTLWKGGVAVGAPTWSNAK